MFKVHFDVEYHSPIDGVRPASQSFDVEFYPCDFQKYFLNLLGHCLCITLGDNDRYGDYNFKHVEDND